MTVVSERLSAEVDAVHRQQLWAHLTIVAHVSACRARYFTSGAKFRERGCSGRNLDATHTQSTRGW
jgi:hypothetical protein